MNKLQIQLKKYQKKTWTQVLSEKELNVNHNDQISKSRLNKMKRFY